MTNLLRSLPVQWLPTAEVAKSSTKVCTAGGSLRSVARLSPASTHSLSVVVLSKNGIFEFPTPSLSHWGLSPREPSSTHP